MSNKGCDGCLGKPKVIADAGEAVPQNMRRDVSQAGPRKSFLGGTKRAHNKTGNSLNGWDAFDKDGLLRDP